ncbi:MAG: DUF5666 domain-containing protein [Betaproteobacteria bacterium]
MTHPTSALQTLWNRLCRVAPALPALAATAVLVACGGGGGSTATPPTATATTVFASGPITGFGSVIVNGVRFDDSGATMDDEDGGSLAESQLRLGMQVDVDGDGDKDDATHGRAHALHVHSALVGPVGAVDTAAGTLTVLGQTVTANAQTVFDTAIAGGLAGIASGAVVRVHGQFDSASQSYLATRIELAPAANHFKIRGTITALDATARTLQIGATAIDFSTTANVPTTLAVGSLIVARLATTPVNGVWTATAIGDGHRAMHDHDEAHLRGVISDFTSVTQFSVDGNPVDATNARFPDGQAGVVLGASVEVEGQLVAGVVVARVVGLEDESHHDGQRVELHGKIGALDTTAQTFVVRGVTVSYAGSVEFDHGSAAALANDLFVEVKGGLSADGTTVAATRIDLQPKD